MTTEPLLLYPKQAQKLLGVGTTKFYELIKSPNFPKAKNPLGKRPMYLREELENWVRNLD
ncbi:Helix-turn-helix domain protein [Legionella sainthelensi]|uniref:Helix-turn-helix domain protein n=1 Tax=Legionella sainthelensi TaxID=28087 RepID=A0A0W0YQ04_9GAMM|nr:helix-turn-helix domain-containing protein [Legionella sainthelensi]KTD58799.1 Helix-turn-helix domain protein [Legionella sainthelensi]VEH34137.1 Predicted transcriptional regulator [Legionella sainthelensi]